jgi:flavodoxin
VFEHGNASRVPRVGSTVSACVDLLSIAAVRVLILYESRRGFTLTVARAMRDVFRERGVDATTAPLRSVDVGTIAAADALVVGTWVTGLILFRVGPAPGVWDGIEALPDLAGRPTIVFCTCEIAPRGTLDTLSAWLERRGADVVGRAVFRRKKSLATVPDAVDGILQVLEPAP